MSDFKIVKFDKFVTEKRCREQEEENVIRALYHYHLTKLDLSGRWRIKVRMFYFSLGY